MSTKTKYKLVIVESPAKAKTISKFLGSTYRVHASNGHVRDLPKSQIGVDIEGGFVPKYITIRGRSQALAKIRKDAKGASAVYLATDPDREGEAIAWHLAQSLGLDQEAKNRITFNEITQSAVKDAIAHARTITQQKVDAQQARRVLDRLVGYKISPLLWAHVRKRLSAGRVQSAVTRMIVDKEDEVLAFVPRTYFTVDVTLHRAKGKANFAVTLMKDSRRAQEFDKMDKAKAVLDEIQKSDITVKDLRTGNRTQTPQPPFTTSALQQEASRRLGFTTKRTMMVAQQLYEGVDIAKEGTVGLVSYIRTDSVRISQEAADAAKQHIMATFGADYLPATPHAFKGRKGAQDAHEAIRPTYMALSPDKIKDSLTNEQFKLYRLIYARFLASQMSSAVFDTLQAEIMAGKHLLRYTCEAVKFAGYRAAYIESAEDETAETHAAARLPALEVGEALSVSQCEVKEHQTQPPARFTEATLVRALETLGIGRPSTYAPIIATILERGYCQRQGKTLHPTELGRVVTDIMKQHFPEIVDVTFTAGMEEELDAIEEGSADYKGVLGEFYSPFEEQFKKAEATMEKVEIKDEVSDVPCEKCGAMMVYKMGRFGKFLACPNFPTCRNTKNITQEVAAPCPKCGGQVLARRTKTGRIFYGCQKYPDCDYRSWDMPIAEKCPVCGGSMVQKTVRGASVGRCADVACPGMVELKSQGQDE